MPFGLRNAAQTYQRFIDEVLRGQDFAVSYIGDILVASDNEEQHRKHLNKIFQFFKKYGIVINPSMCTWGVSNVKFLGFVVSG